MNRKEYFNHKAETWDQMYYTPKLKAFLQDLVAKVGLKPGQRILDLGTGTGVLIPFLLQAVSPTGWVTAIDYSENMIIKCKAKYSHLPNVTIERQDVLNLHLPPESFDAIICFGLFPHLRNKDKALHNMNDVLKPGGKLIIAHALSSDEISQHHRDVSSTVSHDVLPQKPVMRRLLKSTGFIEPHIIDEPGRYLCVSTKP